MHGAFSKSPAGGVVVLPLRPEPLLVAGFEVPNRDLRRVCLLRGRVPVTLGL
jgi:hypothetical protein